MLNPILFFNKKVRTNIEIYIFATSLVFIIKINFIIH